MTELPKHQLLPIITLTNNAVLLPGTTLRIPIQDRPDIPAILSALYSQTPSTSSNAPPSTAWIGCVPTSSPLLSPEGLPLREDEDIRVRRTAEHIASGENPSDINRFAFGVVARVAGVQGQRRGELALLVQGVRRCRVERYTQFTPYVQAEVTILEEEGIAADDTEGQRLFRQLKEASKELVALLRLSSLLPRSASMLSSMLVRRLELFIAKQELHEAGTLADFMANIVDATLEEKLQVLAAWDLKVRLEMVNTILVKHVQSIKKNVKITAITTSTIPPQGVDITNMPPEQRNALMRRVMGDLGLGPRPPGMPRGPPENGDAELNELDELKQKLDNAKLTADAQKVADRELKRLRRMNPAQAEYGVCRTYLENLSEIPWSSFTEDRLGVETLYRARQQLDQDHYGLEKIKKRLLEYLAVLRLKQTMNASLDAALRGENEQAAAAGNATLSNPTIEAETSPSPGQDLPPSNRIPPAAILPREHTSLPDQVPNLKSTQIELLKRKRMVDKSPILLLVGPPGTGKTSLAQSVAQALGRSFHRISLGGVRDEAEIRGHRRTYVAAMPGLIVAGLKKVGVANPVFLLDEIDKVGGANFHGDPSAAMLEVLDPEQNHSFTDHYVNIPIDLSRVLFIATANSVETIPAPLLDRMETIPLSGYTTIEKRHIATRHLVPKQTATNGLPDGAVAFADGVLDTIITSYTREAGVRNLEREIGAICRHQAVAYAEAHDKNAATTSSSSSAIATFSTTSLITNSALETILGPPRFDPDLAATYATPGIVTGLVAFASGTQGSILFIEVASTPGRGPVQATGTLGAILKESIDVALTWVRAHAVPLGLASNPSIDITHDRALHVHCPRGAVPKDGPSAGLALAIALVSLFSRRIVPPTLAMTGELSLRGRVLPVGGVPEKLIGAMAAGVRVVLVPEGNRRDVVALPEEVRSALDIRMVGSVWEAVRLIWPEERWWEEGMMESRL